MGNNPDYAIISCKTDLEFLAIFNASNLYIYLVLYGVLLYTSFWNGSFWYSCFKLVYLSSHGTLQFFSVSTCTPNFQNHIRLPIQHVLIGTTHFNLPHSIFQCQREALNTILSIPLIKYYHELEIQFLFHNVFHWNVLSKHSNTKKGSTGDIHNPHCNDHIHNTTCKHTLLLSTTLLHSTAFVI